MLVGVACGAPCSGMEASSWGMTCVMTTSPPTLVTEDDITDKAGKQGDSSTKQHPETSALTTTKRHFRKM